MDRVSFWLIVAVLIVAFATLTFAQSAKPAEAKPPVDVAAMNASLDKDFQLLKLKAQLAAKDRDNAVLQFNALKTEFDQKTADLNKTFTKASDDLEVSRKAILDAFKVTDGSVTFDATKGEFALPASPAGPTVVSSPATK